MPFIRATAQLTMRGDGARFVRNLITPATKSAVAIAAQTVLEAAQAIVPVDTGQLRDSGKVEVVETDKSVVGQIVFSAPHAAYVEFGTGRRGSESPGSGPYPYTMTWPGMAARPFLRNSLDSTRDTVREVLASQIALAFRY